MCTRDGSGRVHGWETALFGGVYRYNKNWWASDADWVEPTRPLFVRRCHVDGWRLTRIGPFDSQGPEAKHALGMSTVVPAGTCVDASVLAPTEEDGTLVGAPPIVQHHVHVIARTSIFEDQRAWATAVTER